MARDYRYITHFTNREGGEWKSWPRDLKNSIDIIKLKNRTEVLRASRDMHFRGLTIHALRFSTGDVWDCLNGIRRGMNHERLK
jgi:hypothetical protein